MNQTEAKAPFLWLSEEVKPGPSASIWSGPHRDYKELKLLSGKYPIELKLRTRVSAGPEGYFAVTFVIFV